MASYSKPESAYVNLVSEANAWVRFTNAAAVTLTGPVRVLGFLVATSSSGTVTITDNGAALLDTTTVLAGTWYPFPGLSAGNVVFTPGGTVSGVLFYAV